MNLRALGICTILTIVLFSGFHPMQAVAQPDACISDIHTAEINGTTLHYIECGDGEPLVLVHGGLGDYRTWISQIGAFSEEYRVISYSRRYHYPNPWSQDASSFSVTVHANDLAEFIQSLELEQVHLVGHSFGAFIALLVAQENPELVQTLTLGEPPVIPLVEPSHPGDPNLLVAREVFEAGGDAEEALRQFVDEVLGNGAFDNLPPPVRVRMMDNARELRGAAMEENIYPPFSCRDAREVNVPTLLLDGELSPEIFGNVNDILERCLPTAERAVIPEASHDLKIQEPPVFSETVLPFIDRF